MPPHKRLEALVRAAARYFHVTEEQLRATGGRYLPLCQFRQITQLVAYENGYPPGSIAMGFDYSHYDSTSVRKNIHVARNHINQGQLWWVNTKAVLIDAWSEEVGGG